MKTVFVIFVTSCFLLTGCFVPFGNSSTDAFTPLQKEKLSTKPEAVTLYFEGESVPFPYEKRGLVEVRGSDEATVASLLDRLKYAAYQDGADAVIQIKKTYTYREKGILADVLDQDRKKDMYESVTFNGIAVKVLYDSTYKKPKYSIPDTLFLKTVNRENEAYAKSVNSGMLWSFIATVAVVFYALIHSGK